MPYELFRTSYSHNSFYCYDFINIGKNLWTNRKWFYKIVRRCISCNACRASRDKNAEGIPEQMHEAGRIPGAFLHREDL